MVGCLAWSLRGYCRDIRPGWQKSSHRQQFLLTQQQVKMDGALRQPESAAHSPHSRIEKKKKNLGWVDLWLWGCGCRVSMLLYHYQNVFFHSLKLSKVINHKIYTKTHKAQNVETKNKNTRKTPLRNQNSDSNFLVSQSKWGYGQCVIVCALTILTQMYSMYMYIILKH